ncbi:MAG: general secretion pathway protein GspN [Rheinheimera sp.]|uniref:type II secretion system protein N n=1 Tax=Arsukibacterium sp. UBA3155 TaxID=1946058 RepID=UPI000C8FAA54|nr:type II secretion system protein N [Arsukibacterium sp. UBA3155]MAD76521.1 general secretion pathway protein GspN [Rheinheimera sp.]|tara:strand:+ start:174144 stop:174887 length:744 start_codon:yes stop_codon:yes gene_type:complete
MKYWKLTLAAFLAYLVFMLYLLPAAWVLHWVGLPPNVNIGPVQGTVWQGSATLVQYQNLQFQQLRWRFNGWSLFTLAPQVTLTAGSIGERDQPYAKASLAYSFSGLKMQQALLRIPVSQLLPLLELPLPVAATGELMVEVQDFQQGKPWCNSLAGNASWLDARLQPPTGTWLELNSIVADLRCEQGSPVLITDGENSLGLAVTAGVENSRLTVNGSLKPDPSLPSEVHQAMQFVGRPDAQGRYTIQF